MYRVKEQRQQLAGVPVQFDVGRAVVGRGTAVNDDIGFPRRFGRKRHRGGRFDGKRGAHRYGQVAVFGRPEGLDQDKKTHFTLRMRTAGGKPIGPADLALAHTQKLHLLIVDPTLSDYQHVHPEPGRWNGEWEFDLKPERAGDYRVFADFTPLATQRGLYAAVDFNVPGEVASVIQVINTTVQSDNYDFELVLPRRFRAGVPADLTLRIERSGTEKKPVPLKPVMGAFAHVVAFDEQRSGFAHLHPQQTDLSKPPDVLKPELNFKVLIPKPGRYVIWAQVKLTDDESFVPFWVDVLPGGKKDDVPEIAPDKSPEPKDDKDKGDDEGGLA